MKILIVGDRAATAHQLRFALTAAEPRCAITVVESIAQGAPPLGNEDAVDLVFVMMTADTSEALQTLRRLRSWTDARLVAVDAADEPQRILECLRAGADDFLDETGDVLQQTTAKIERVKLKTFTAEQKGRLISIVSACGGIGATVTAANLAVLIAQAHDSCGLIDLTGSPGDLAQLLSLNPKHTLGDLCENLLSFDHEMLMSSLTVHDSGVQLIASALADDADSHQVEDVQHIIEEARRCLSTVVMDLNHRLRFASALLESSDVIVLMTALNFNAACATRRLLAIWNERGIASDRVLLVAGRCGQAGEIPVKKAEKILGRNVDACVCEEQMAVNLSVNCGHPVVLEQPKSRVTKDLCRLASKLKTPPTSPGGQMPDGHSGLQGDTNQQGRDVLQRIAGIFF